MPQGGLSKIGETGFEPATAPAALARQAAGRGRDRRRVRRRTCGGSLGGGGSLRDAPHPALPAATLAGNADDRPEALSTPTRRRPALPWSRAVEEEELQRPTSPAKGAH